MLSSIKRIFSPAILSPYFGFSIEDHWNSSRHARGCGHPVAFVMPGFRRPSYRQLGRNDMEIMLGIFVTVHERWFSNPKSI